MVTNLFRRMFGYSDKSTELAKSRLHFVLVQDRSGLNQEELNSFRTEMIEVIGKYFTIKEEDFEISYEREEETTTLVINSPVALKRAEAEAKRSKKKRKAAAN